MKIGMYDVCRIYIVDENLIYWNNAFPRQCPKLGVESFMANGVRPSLIPVLVSYFQDRQMSVKWHGCRSVPKSTMVVGLKVLPWGSWNTWHSQTIVQTV